MAQGVKVTLGNISHALAGGLHQLGLGPHDPPAAQTAGLIITIGRDPKSDIQIDLPIVSWNHAVITEENGKYILKTGTPATEPSWAI